VIDILLEKGLLERVEPDRDAAREVLVEARRHLDSASLISGDDPNGAYQLLYDAARKAILAHMLEAGLRVSKRKPGGHETTGRYGLATIGTASAGDAMANFDRMRRNRNRSEYELRFFDDDEIVADLAHARAIVEAVEATF
jgi:hypothetical protein